MVGVPGKQLSPIRGVSVLLVLFAAAVPWSVLAQAPVSFTQPAWILSPSTAQLNGMAVPKGSETKAWFELGTDTAYGSSTSSTNIGSGTKTVRVSLAITGLATGITYHCRLAASNTVSTTYGPDQPFTTGARIATWYAPCTGFPPIPQGLNNIASIGCGHSFSMAVRNDGSLVAWLAPPPSFYPGFPDVGQANPPPGVSNVVAVAGGFADGFALKQDGIVQAWGKFADGSGPDAYVPSGLSNVVAIAAGDNFALALKGDGTVTAWGTNTSGGETSVPSPMFMSNVVAIAAASASGSGHGLALKADGTVTGWGFFYTQPPPWLSNVIAITTETAHNLALRADGTVVAWGDNTVGQTNVPPGLSNVVAISAGYGFSLALRADGSLVAWGNGPVTGCGYTNAVPAALANTLAICSGDVHTLALSSSDLPPRALPKSVTGGVNKDMAVSLSGWDPNGDYLGFRVETPPTNGLLFQYSPTGRGSPITAPGTPVSDPSGRVVFAPKPDTFGAPYDSFYFSANDGQYDSGPAVLTAKIVPSPILQNPVFSRNASVSFGFTFTGLSNETYSVYGSADLLNWIFLGFCGQPSPGQFSFSDGGVTNWQQRFYRIKAQ